MFVMVQPPDSVTTRADVTMHSLMGAGKTQLLVVVEDQHTSNGTSNAAWDETVKQLADYMIQCRKEDTHKREVTGFLPYDMYGA
jgi:cytochrome c1